MLLPSGGGGCDPLRTEDLRISCPSVRRHKPVSTDQQSQQPLNTKRVVAAQWQCRASSVRKDLQDIEVTLIVMSKGVLASSEAVEQQHAIAEDVCAIALTSLPPAACY